MAGRAIPPEELRLALVMNGGVSLAVWIGGVTREIARLLSRQSAYGELLDWLCIEPRVDVIAGTSAGGVNGAWLAMALAYHPAGPELESQTGALRELWVGQAAFEDLLRSPYQKNPPSFLDGDGFYYDILREAFDQLQSAAPTDKDAVPIDLVLTTTLLSGDASNHADDFGNRVGDVNHRARFRFSRGPDMDDDAFASANIVEQLAVAARSTSSFPAAFEPRFCRIGDASDSLGPDMAGIANFDRSHFVVDGGVLDNKPIDAALDCIFAQRADRPARRVLAYVVPDPQITSAEPGGDKPDARPALIEVALDSLMKIPAVQSISSQIEALRRHNDAVRHRKRMRVILTENMDADTIDSLAGNLFQAYRDMRVAKAVDVITHDISGGLADKSGGAALGPRGRREWLDARVRAEADALPWIPSISPTEPGSAAERQDDWRWGTLPPQHLSRLLLDLVSRTQHLAQLVMPEANLAKSWTDAFDLIRRADALREDGPKYWRQRAPNFEKLLGGGGGPLKAAPEAERWFRYALATWRINARKDAPGVAADVAQTLLTLIGIAGPILKDARKHPAEPVRRDGAQLEALLGFFVRAKDRKEGKPASADLVLQRLLIFEVVQEVLDGEAIDAEEVVRFLQITGDGSAAFGGPSRAVDKLSGVQLAHFGAFYKTSWRANDWMWGRLDAIRRLVPLLLDPARLRLVAGGAVGKKQPSEVAAARIEAIALGALEPADAQSRPVLEARFSRDQLRAELRFLDDPAQPLPERLPTAVDALTRRLELDVLRAELPLIRCAIVADQHQHMFVSREATEFLGRCAAVIPPGQANAPVEHVADLLRLCRVGQEKFMAELGTDRATMVASQTAAVAVAAIREERGWLKAIGALFGLLRLPTLLFYNFARNTLYDSKTGVAVNVGLFAASLAIVATAAFRSGVYPAPVVIVALTVFAVALLFLVVRLSRRWRLALWLVPVAGAAGALLFGRSVIGRSIANLDTERIALVEAVVLVVIAVGALAGSIRARRATQSRTDAPE